MNCPCANVYLSHAILPPAAERLGFLNKTCSAGTKPGNYGSTFGPVLRTMSDGTQWKQWELKVLSKPDAAGAVDAAVSTYYPLSGEPL